MGRLKDLRDAILSALEPKPYLSALAAGIDPGRIVSRSVSDSNSEILAELIRRAVRDGKTLWLDFPRAEFSRPMYFPDPIAGLTMVGNGASSTHGGTELVWRNGPSFTRDVFTDELKPTSLFRFLNARDSVFSGFRVTVASPLGHVFHSTTLRGSWSNVPSTNLKFKDILIDGINGMLLNGFLYDRAADDPKNEANNDMGYFSGVYVINYGIGNADYLSPKKPYAGHKSSAFHFDGAQSREHLFVRCGANASKYNREWSGLLYGVIGSSFTWIGGSVSSCDWNFQKLSWVGDPVQISHCNSEGSRGMLLDESVHRAAAGSVTIEHVRFALNAARDGDVFVRMLNAGPLVIRNCTTDGPPGIKHRISEFGPKLHPESGTHSAFTMTDCIWRTNLELDQIVRYPNEPEEGEAGHVVDKWIRGNRREFTDATGQQFYERIPNVSTP